MFLRAKKINTNSQYLNILLDVNNIVLLMFIRLIKSSKYDFLMKVIHLSMYKKCINSYMTIKQGPLLKLYLKNTFI